MMASKPRVYVTRRIPQVALDALSEHTDMTFWDSEDPVPRNELLSKCANVDGLLCTISDEIDEEIVEAAGPGLKIISTMAAGTNNICVSACRKKGIDVVSTPDVTSDCAAELTVALLLMTTRRLMEGVTAVTNGEWGKWKPMWLCGVEIVGKTLGILGFGRVGFGVARRLKPFGVSRILYHDVSSVSYADDVQGEYVTFDKLLEESDFLCVCCALTPQTRNLFTTETFKKMKRNAILINTSRGAVINHGDLCAALDNADIMAAGLDVTDPEPLPTDHPLLSQEKCIILPHMGTNTKATRNNMAANAAENIIAVLCEQD